MRRIALAICLAALAPGAAFAQEALCADPGAACAGQLSSACIDRLGAGAIAATSPDRDCEVQMASYRDCLANAARSCGSAPPPQSDAADEARAQAAYEAVRGRGEPELLRMVVDRYPGTIWAALAARDADEIEASASDRAAPQSAPVDAAKDGRRLKLYESASQEVCGHRLTLRSVWRESDGGAKNKITLEAEGVGAFSLSGGEVKPLAEPACGVRLERAGRDPRYFAQLTELSLEESAPAAQ